MATYTVEEPKIKYEVEKPSKYTVEEPKYEVSEVPAEWKGKKMPFIAKGIYERTPFGKRVVSMLPHGEQFKQRMQAIQPETIGQSLAQAGGSLAGMLPAISPLTGALGTVGGLATYGALQPAETMGQRVLEAGKGALFGGVLKAVGAIPQVGTVPYLRALPRMGAGAAAFGVPAKLAGAPTHEVAAQAILGAALSAKGKPKIERTPEAKPVIQPQIRPQDIEALRYQRWLAERAPTIRPEIRVAGKYANNINLSKLPQELREPIAQFITDNPKVGKTPRISNKQTIERMSQLRETPTMKYLLENPEGQLAAEVLKIRQGSMDTISKVLTKDLTALKGEMDTTISRSLEQYRRVGAETGRALQQFNIPIKARQSLVSQIDAKIAQIKGDPLFSGNKTLIKGLQNLKQQIGGKELNPTVFDRLYFVWLNSILSDPRTHMVNTGSNTLFALAKIPEKFFQALLDLPVALKTGKRSAYFGEIPAMVRGLISTKRVPVAKGSKFEELTPVKGLGKVLPTELLKIEDVLGKQMVGRMEKYAEAYRYGIAVRKGFRGLPGSTGIRAEQTYRTFQNEPGRIAKSVMNLRKLPGVRWILPFVKTPANIIDRAFERTPVGVLGIRKGMPQAEISSRLGLATMGSLTSTWIAHQFFKGNITGDVPSDKNERDAFYRTGKQPNAIKIAGQWVPFERIEPLGTAMALVTNTIQNYQKSNSDIPSEKVLDAVLPLGRTLTNKTYLQGLTNMIKAVSDPEMYGASWGRKIASGFASPGLLNYIAQLQDPYIRRPETTLETVKARLPGLSKEVRPRLTAFGEPIERAMPAIPLRISKERISPLEEELNRLGLTISFPAKTIKKQKLSPDEYNRYIQESGQNIKRVLTFIMNTPLYRIMPDEARTKVIERIEREAREKPRMSISYQSALRELKKITNEEKKKEYLKELPDYTKRLLRLKK